jgi:hypothetical protein
MAGLLKPSIRAEEAHELKDMSSEGKRPEDDFEDMENLDQVATAGGFAPEEEKSVVKKLDRRVVGLISLLYLLSFLDRSSKPSLPLWNLVLTKADIGNAKIAGLMNDLKLSNDQYEWLLSAFYLTYIAFEWMALL